MSEAIRCEACRWFRHTVESLGICELAPPVFLPECDVHRSGWGQHLMTNEEGCSRGEPKTSPLTVSDGVPVVVVDGRVVFRSNKTGDAT